MDTLAGSTRSYLLFPLLLIALAAGASAQAPSFEGIAGDQTTSPRPDRSQLLAWVSTIRNKQTRAAQAFFDLHEWVDFTTVGPAGESGARGGIYWIDDETEHAAMVDTRYRRIQRAVKETEDEGRYGKSGLIEAMEDFQLAARQILAYFAAPPPWEVVDDELLEIQAHAVENITNYNIYLDRIRGFHLEWENFAANDIARFDTSGLERLPFPVLEGVDRKVIENAKGGWILKAETRLENLLVWSAERLAQVDEFWRRLEEKASSQTRITDADAIEKTGQTFDYLIQVRIPAQSSRAYREVILDVRAIEQCLDDARAMLNTAQAMLHAGGLTETEPYKSRVAGLEEKVRAKADWAAHVALTEPKRPLSQSRWILLQADHSTRNVFRPGS